MEDLKMNKCNVQINRRRKNTILSPTVLVLCLNGLRYGGKSRGLFFENMITGPQRVIIYSKKREINITAGTKLHRIIHHGLL